MYQIAQTLRNLKYHFFLSYVYIYIYLVGGFSLSEKYESQLFTLFPIYGKSKKNMFQTTNQIYMYNIYMW